MIRIPNTDLPPTDPEPVYTTLMKFDSVDKGIFKTINDIVDKIGPLEGFQSVGSQSFLLGHSEIEDGTKIRGPAMGSGMLWGFQPYERTYIQTFYDLPDSYPYPNGVRDTPYGQPSTQEPILNCSDLKECKEEYEQQYQRRKAWFDYLYAPIDTVNKLMGPIYRAKEIDQLKKNIGMSQSCGYPVSEVVKY